MEAATLHLKGTHKDPHLPKKGPKGHTTKPSKQTGIIAIQNDIVTLTDDIQAALATHKDVKSPKSSPSSPSSKALTPACHTIHKTRTYGHPEHTQKKGDNTYFKYPGLSSCLQTCPQSETVVR
ncbi:hypothetical protein M433DRAFT_157910 [Acidomyces richmondensis BFW]|nr:MAG: hypothetical protein FE78DRAFT_84608 [Acidomyces sp. 'richmondensis']KYG42418.1 hypothetical protein M433DRAFT_157910 [Acidomyces richmondensis BFW]